MTLKQFSILSAASLALTCSLPAWSEAPAEPVSEPRLESGLNAPVAQPEDTTQRAATKTRDDQGTIVLPGVYMEKPEDLDIPRPKRDLSALEAATKRSHTSNAGH